MPERDSLPRQDISPERKVEGLAYVLACCRRSYPGQEMTLSNLLSLVEKVADAAEKEDLRAEAVHGLRLLDMSEVAQLDAILRLA